MKLKLPKIKFYKFEKDLSLFTTGVTFDIHGGIEAYTAYNPTLPIYNRMVGVRFNISFNIPEQGDLISISAETESIILKLDSPKLDLNILTEHIDNMCDYMANFIRSNVSEIDLTDLKLNPDPNMIPAIVSALEREGLYIQSQ